MRNNDSAEWPSAPGSAIQKSLVERPYFYATGMDRTVHAYSKEEEGVERLPASLTVEDYGVHKGDFDSAVKPNNSAGGLLFLSILITVIMGVVVALIVKLFVDGTEEPNWGQLVFAIAFALWIIPTSWRYYFKERKAVRLRRAAGKTLEPPTRRSSRPDW